MRKMKMFTKQLLSFVIVASGLLTSIQAGIIGNDKCLIDTSTYSGCTANDVGIAAMRVIGVTDGCVNDTNDTVTIQIEVDITSGQPERYGVGIHIDVGGGDAVASGNTCVHEALFDQSADNTDLDATSGIGPFLNSDDDLAGNTCGSVGNKVTYTRRIVQGDIVTPGPSSTQALDIVMNCSDTTDKDGGAANGYLDFGWAVGWTVDKSSACTSISQAIAEGPAKCQNGVQDTQDGLNPVPIGIPDMDVAINCSPTSLNVGQTTTCTVTYSNGSPLGAADMLKFKVNYPSDQGSITSAITKSQVAETAIDDGNGIVDWTMENGQTLGNIAVSTTNTLTFDYTYTGGPDFDISIDTFFDNGTDPESNQNLSATQLFTTLPVTVSYVHPQEGANGLEVNFSTSSETSNIGFNIYAVKGKTWTKLNETIIPGALDSFEPKDYHVALSLPSDLDVNKVGIAGIDASGKEDRHGPYKVGKAYGTKVKVNKVDWAKVNKQLSTSNKIVKQAQVSAQTINVRDHIVNFEVSENGLYKVTHNDLFNAGIDLTGLKVEKMALSLKGEGILRHIDGSDVRNRWTSDSSISFIGEAPTGSDKLYVKENLYRLHFQASNVRISEPIPPIVEDVKVFETNNRYSYSLPQEDPFRDATFYALGNGSEGKLNRTFEMPALPDGTSTLKINLSGYTFGNHQVIVSLNGVQIASESTDGHVDWPIEIEVDNNLMTEGNNILTLTIPNRDGVFDYLVYDKLTVSYNDEKVNDILTPKIMTTKKVLKIDILPKEGENYVIIAHPLFINDTLTRYVSQRQGEGWKIKVVNVEDIYQAFGYGMVTPDAIREYLKWARSRGVTHAQLVGASTYDYHDYLGTGAVSFIPSLYVNTNNVIHFTPSDTALVVGKFGLPMLAIGRWPVRTLEEFDNVINKTLAWETSGQSSAHTALFVADETDKGMVFGEQMDSIANLFEKKGWSDIRYAYLDDLIKENNGDHETAVTAARSMIQSALEEGASITSYSGHSSPSLWSFKGLLKESDVATIGNTGKTTLALPLACFTTYADSPYTNTLAHQLLSEGENGAVAVYGASVTSSYGDNGLAAKGLVLRILKGDDLGTAIKRMKRKLGAKYRDTILNGQLMGDVTLQVK